MSYVPALSLAHVNRKRAGCSLSPELIVKWKRRWQVDCEVLNSRVPTEWLPIGVRRPKEQDYYLEVNIFTQSQDCDL
jgi:hypothetical protein